MFNRSFFHSFNWNAFCEGSVTCHLCDCVKEQMPVRQWPRGSLLRKCSTQQNTFLGFCCIKVFACSPEFVWCPYFYSIYRLLGRDQQWRQDFSGVYSELWAVSKWWWSKEYPEEEVAVLPGWRHSTNPQKPHVVVTDDTDLELEFLCYYLFRIDRIWARFFLKNSFPWVGIGVPQHMCEVRGWLVGLCSLLLSCGP